MVDYSYAHLSNTITKQPHCVAKQPHSSWKRALDALALVGYLPRINCPSVFGSPADMHERCQIDDSFSSRSARSLFFSEQHNGVQSCELDVWYFWTTNSFTQPGAISTVIVAYTAPVAAPSPQARQCLTRRSTMDAVSMQPMSTVPCIARCTNMHIAVNLKKCEIRFFFFSGASCACQGQTGPRMVQLIIRT